MPRFSLSVFALSLVFAACNSPVELAPRETMPESAPTPPDFGSWLSMDVAPNGQQPVIAYYDREERALGFGIGTLDSKGEISSWFHERVDGYGADEDLGKYASMKVGPDGTVWISYYDATNKHLRFARRVVGARGEKKPALWVKGEIDAAGSVGTWSSLALDNQGMPWVAYHDAGTGALKLAHLDEDPGLGTDAETVYHWTSAVVYQGAPFAFTDADGNAVTRPGKAGEHARLQILGNSFYIAFYDRAEGSLRFAQSDDAGASFKISRIAPEEPDGVRDVGQWPSFRVGQDKISIAFHDVGNQDLDFATGSARDGWATSVVDAGDFVGADTELIQASGTARIVYFDGQTNDMKIASRTGSTWVSQTIAGADGAVGFHNEVVQIDNTFYAASYDFTPRAVFFTAIPDLPSSN